MLNGTLHAQPYLLIAEMLMKALKIINAQVQIIELIQ